MYAPLHRHRPAHRWTFGDIAAQVGTDLGLPPDDEQRWILDTIYGEKAPERPSCFEVAVISPRQNIKTSTLGVAALADLFVFGVERHLWTAHHGDTLKGTFNDFRSWIKSNPDYDEQVTFYEGHQDMAIVHRETGNTIDFQSRTGKAGRGLTGVKRITLDEALYLEPKHVGAVYPTMLTRPGAQVRIGSSAGLQASEQLRRIRERGRSGKDKRLGYVEYGATLHPCGREDCAHEYGAEGCAYDDRDLWWQANCALWPGRITEEAVEDLRKSMPPDEFGREMLSVWDDPPNTGESLISLDDWNAVGDADAIPAQSLKYAVDVSPGHASGSIVVCGANADGTPVLELVERHPGTSWIGERLAELVAVHGGVVGLDLAGPVGSLVPEFEHLGIPLEMLQGRDAVSAAGGLVAAVTERRVLHREQGAMAAAVQGASRRAVGDAWKWSRKDSTVDISPLVAAGIALWLHGSRPREVDPGVYVL